MGRARLDMGEELEKSHEQMRYVNIISFQGLAEVLYGMS